MQTSVPELMDFSSEPQYVLDSYGVNGMDGSFAANCLLARRLVEAGVSFVEVVHRGWDDHSGAAKPIAAREWVAVLDVVGARRVQNVYGSPLALNHGCSPEACHACGRDIADLRVLKRSR